MLAELAAANAAFQVIKTTVSHGGDLARCAKQIGDLVGAKESLQKKVTKKKATHQTNDFEEFMALERVREQEAQLEQLMIYAGRPGLLADWQQFQREARKARRQAEIDAKKKREEMIELIGIILVSIVLVGALIGFVLWMLWMKGYL